MKIRRIISMILCLCLLSACASAGSTSSVKTVSETKNYPDSLNISCQGAFNNAEYHTDAEALGEWTAYMNDTYPFEITLDASYADETFDAVKGGIQKGMAAMPTAYVLSLTQSKKILPLDEYLKDNKLWNSLPAEYKNLFEYDGHIWAIPLSAYVEPEVLSIRTDWLAAVGMKMPTNTAELLEVGRAFMKKDANKNGKADDYLMGGYPSFVMEPFLNAYGCYTGAKMSSLAYDPALNSIRDGLFKPNAMAALQYVRTLISEELIDPMTYYDSRTSLDNMNNGEYGLAAGTINTGKYHVGVNWVKNNAQKIFGRAYDDKSEEDYQYATGIYEALPPLSDQYPITYQYEDWGYVLTSATHQPQETVNAFVDMLFSSKQHYLECTYGIPSHYVLSDNNVLYLKYAKEATKTAYTKPGLVYLDNMILGDNFYTDGSISSEYFAQIMSHSNEAKEYKNNYIERYKELVVQIPTFYKASGACYTQNIDIYQSAFFNLARILPDETQSIGTLLAVYQKTVSDGYVENTLKECNTYLKLNG